MSYEPVDIYVTDTTLAKTPIQGVVVKLFSQDGTHVWGQNVTDAQGRAGFLLPVGSYQARFYLQQTTFPNPLLLDVLASPAENKFYVKGQRFEPPTVNDARLCMAYGFFRTFTGAPAQRVEIHFHAKFNPLLLDDAGVLTSLQRVRTDERGYVQVPLIKHGQFDVVVQGMEDMMRMITVPDAPNVNLPHLLFPVVSSVVFDPPVTGGIDLAVGQEMLLTPTVFTSDENVLDGIAASDVRWSSSNESILAVLPAGRQILIRGIAPGTANIHVDRLDTSIIQYPDPGISGNDVPVTVT